MPSFKIENSLYKKGFNLIAGIDEAGRGPLAGPVVSAAVIFPKNVKIKHLDDSKKLTPEKREKLYEIILEKAYSIGVGFVSESTIDKINILQATFLSMRKAIKSLNNIPDYILVDGNLAIPGTGILQRSIIKGDSIVASISAASIVAKVLRDRYMIKLDRKYPQYGFRFHKGYGTKLHFEMIVKHGLCPIHRKTFLHFPHQPT